MSGKSALNLLAATAKPEAAKAIPGTFKSISGKSNLGALVLSSTSPNPIVPSGASIMGLCGSNADNQSKSTALLVTLGVVTLVARLGVETFTGLTTGFAIAGVVTVILPMLGVVTDVDNGLPVVLGILRFGSLIRQQIPKRRNSQHSNVPKINASNTNEIISILAMSKVYAMFVF